MARGRVWTGADALERGLVDELGGLRTAINRAKVLAGHDEDDDVRIVSYSGSSFLDFLRPKPSSQPAAASLPEAVAAMLGRSVVEMFPGRAVVDRRVRTLARRLPLLGRGCQGSPADHCR